MEGDADFEHARLLKIHTSVVVSARSVKEGFLWGRALNISYIALQHSAEFASCFNPVVARKYPTITLFRHLYSSCIPTLIFI